MPRFFFDIYEDDTLQRDEDGLELAGHAQARREAQRLLPKIAYHELPGNGDRKSYVVLANDEHRKPIYPAPLN